MYYQTKTATPCAFITKDKLRLKQFGHNVYLKNGSEFELELFNPSQSTVLAKIRIDGNYISGGGIVLKPGQRIYLERFLDDAKKFKFETYEVDSTSNEVLNAISNNGNVDVEFYEEYIKPTYQQPFLVNYPLVNPLVNYPSTNPNPYYVNTFTTTGLGDTVSTYTSSVGFNSSNSGDSTLSFTNGFSNKVDLQKPRSRSLTKKSKSIETGRVEKGGNSNQSFRTVNKDFNSYTISTSNWKILPESVKPYESNDLKVHCTECGSKRKKDSHKFCPNCGTKY
jgi:hypothetical protein